MPRLRAVLWVLGALAGCATASPRPVGPSSLGLSNRDTYRHYLASLPAALKMRHQVETRFGDRAEVVEGFCVLFRPERFWVRASAPFGGTLFEIKATSAHQVQLLSGVAVTADDRGPRYLARDIRRIYLQDCAAGATLTALRTGLRASCPLAADGGGIDTARGRDPADDALAVTVTKGGVVREKAFYRGGELSALVRYDDYRLEGGLWLAHQIVLESHTAPYRLTIVLLDADPSFDPAPLFATAPE
ncbi:MAG: DUF3261 domain-containing protein [Deltaproteobacteria bacterium]|nr:DUF3261 domain-containing protein [Deltaproteobacteria bacterium]